MSSLIRALVIGAVILAIAIAALNGHNSTVDGLQYDAARAKLRTAFIERTAWVHAVGNEDRYRDELNQATRWYAAELAQIYNRFPGTKAPEAAIEEAEKLAEEGKMKAADLALRKEFHEETKRFAQLFQSGAYNPLATQVQDGIRLDVVAMQRVQHEGKSRLRLDVAVWGAPRREEIAKDGKGGGTVSTRLDFALKGLSVEFIDGTKKPDEKAKKLDPKVAMAADTGLLLGGGDAGPPELLVEFPERWNTDFPPQFAVGHWWLDPVPVETTKLVLNIGGEVRSTGLGVHPVTYEWTLDPKFDWKLREGEAFEGEERVMTDEELRR